MAKYSGNIGYTVSRPRADDPCIYESNVIETHLVYGDIIDNSRFNNESKDTINGDINISMKVSIIMDDVVTMNISHLKYIEYMGVKWKIKSFSVNRPRLILNLGDVYNE